MLSDNTSEMMMWGAFFVIVMIVVGMWIKGVGFGIADLLGENECAAEVKTHALTMKSKAVSEKFPLGTSPIEVISSEIDCPTRYKEPKSDLKKQIAEEMLWCWDTWGRGELELFPQDEGQYCHVCTVIETDDGGTVEGLLKYLADNKKGNETYLQRIAPYATKGADTLDESIRNAAPESLDASNGVAVVFKYVKGQKKILNFFGEEESKLAGGIGVGGVTGVVAGTVFTGPAGLVVGAVSGALAYAVVDQPREWLAYTAVVPNTQESLEDLNCRIAPAKQS